MESERQTRKRRIDPKLKSSKWKVDPFNQNKPLSWYADTGIEEFSTKDGPADYGLCVDGQLLGIVEAKKLTLGPQNVLTRVYSLDLLRKSGSPKISTAKLLTFTSGQTDFRKRSILGSTMGFPLARRPASDLKG